MIPSMIFPGDVLRLNEDAVLSNTHKAILTEQERALDAPQQFILNSQVIPKGTVLEVSQVVLKGRGSSENFVTFRVLDGAMYPAYDKFVFGKEKTELGTKIKELQAKLDAVSQSSPARQEIAYDIKNRQKRLDSLLKQTVKKGSTKLIKISVQDIESWEIKLTK